MTTPSIYHDFRLILGRHDDGSFKARLAWSPAGDAETHFKLPKSVSPDRPNDRQKMEAIGKELFEHLFVDEVRAKYRASLALLRNLDDHGLRIRLTIDPGQQESNKLLEWPWEHLFDPEGVGFLSRSRKTTLVRDPVQPLALRPLLEDPPPRILAASGAQSPDEPELDLDRELEKIRAAWEGVANVEIRHSVTQTELRRELLHGRYHVLHLIGHGRVDHERQEGTVTLKGIDGSPREVTATELADTLRNVSSLRLVVLNACSTAAMPRTDPMRSVALSLMEVGVPALIANRVPVADDIAITFGEELHRELALGTPVDAAVAEARMAIDQFSILYEGGTATFKDWEFPVLYMSSPDGRIFDHGELHEIRPTENVTEPRPLRLAVRSRRHPFDDLRVESDHVLDLTPSFDGRTIQDPRDWRETVRPAVERFLTRHVTTQRPLRLRLDTHLSIAFTAGYVLDTRGVEVTLRQATMGGFQDWKLKPGEPVGEIVWNSEDGELRPGVTRNEIAVAVSITHDITKDVERHVERHLKRSVRRIVTARTSVLGHAAIRDGAHAFALAEDLSQRLARLPDEGRRPLVHLFLAAPGGFVFFLGQVSRNLGRIRLYEFNFDGDRRYRRSIDLGKKAR